MKKYPFKFLDSYTRSDKDIYFGRQEESSQLYEMIFQSRILLIFGPIGTGKTSLIQCGLAQKIESHDYLELLIRRNTDINESLVETLLKAVEETNLDSDSEMYKLESNEPPLHNHIKNIYLNTFRPIFLIFDQFEELFVLGGEEEEKKFITTIKLLLEIEYPLKFIFCIREEYLGYLINFEKEIPELFHKKLRIEPMGFQKIKDVIISATSIQDSALILKHGQETLICQAVFDKLKTKEKSINIQLPYLQVFLEKLYRSELTTGKEIVTLTPELINHVGNLGDILQEFLENEVVQISLLYPDLKDENIWAILSPFATIEGTKEPINLLGLKQRLPNVKETTLKSIIVRLAERKILRYLEEKDLYELVHDSLAEKIANKRSIDETNYLEARKIITNNASTNEKYRAPFTEAQLHLIEAYKERLLKEGKLNETEQKLINESHAKISAQKEAKFKKVKQERNKAIYFSLILFITLLAVAVSYYEKYQAEQRTNNERNINAAKKFKSSGDQYMQIGKRAEACDSYRQGLDTLKHQQNEILYSELKNLVETCR